ncbi:MAG TPA: glycoside hydrolase family 15 protein [Thermoanaerobaculia bacterium]|nr:glycoside hydrolase family 15 protein [Thermoanaerobaculia bacterium]
MIDPAVSDPYPPIADYALLSDLHSVALVSRRGSIDWCCMPRMDSPSLFGRLLDWGKGGHFVLRPAVPFEVERRYLDVSLVLETVFTTDSGRVRLLDAVAMREGGREKPLRQLLRVVEGVEGEVEMVAEIAPRFGYGDVRPWLRRHGDGCCTALGGDAGLIVSGDVDLDVSDGCDLSARFRVATGERQRLSLQFERPHRLHPELPDGLAPSQGEMDEVFERTLDWWREWSAHHGWSGDPRVLTSAAVIKGLIHAPTGAIAAAATTSLPETMGGERNWDYRYSWIRDSAFALEALDELGFHAEAHGFRHFIERTTAGDESEVQPLYGLGGEHFLPEIELAHLEGYRGSRPVRIGNGAFDQVQLDTHGELLELAWRSTLRGGPPDEVYWRFLRDLVDSVCERWKEPDRGFWEVRDGDHHFTHSKVTCWGALDRGLRVAEHCGLDAPVERWRAARDELGAAIETHGYDAERGTFVRELLGGLPGGVAPRNEVDAALLLLPRHGFVTHDDPRMLRTVDRILAELADHDGRILRYRAADGLEGDEGCFLACTFWLVGCMARQGDERRAEAQRIFDQTAALANDLGLFAEEYDAGLGEMLGNFPQGLSHYSFITAAVALERAAAGDETVAGVVTA